MPFYGLIRLIPGTGDGYAAWEDDVGAVLGVKRRRNGDENVSNWGHAQMSFSNAKGNMLGLIDGFLCAHA